MKQIIIEILGTYTPINNGDGIGSIDFPFIIGGVVFCIFLYFTFKIIIRCFFND